MEPLRTYATDNGALQLNAEEIHGVEDGLFVRGDRGTPEAKNRVSERKAGVTTSSVVKREAGAKVSM